MGSFGRSTEIKIFMTEKDENELFKQNNGNLLFLETNLYNLNPDDIKLKRDIPKSIVFFIINKNIKNNLGEYVKLKKDEKNNSYYLVPSLSPVVDFLRSKIDKENKIIKGGSMATFLSHYDWNVAGKKYEAKQSEEFIKWWNELKKFITKNYIKVYYLDELTKPKKSRILYAGSDAIQFYREGFILLEDMTTCHPGGVSKKEAEEHDKDYLNKLKKGKTKKRFIAGLILTLLFLLTFILGLIPVYPFGVYNQTGSWITSKLTSVVTIPIYPLILLSNFLDKINLPGGKIELLYLVITGIIIILYYYFLSKILIWIYVKINEKIKKK